MKRSIYSKLLEWKQNDCRKPLILNGARQVGKTYILKEFGKNEYKNVAFFSLDRDKKAVSAFEQYTDTASLLRSLSALGNVDIVAGETLVILDEIQDQPKAIQALKYLYEDAPEIHIVVAGSLLGLSLHDGISYPVGKVDELRLYPMSFLEFLYALGKDRIAACVENREWDVLSLMHVEMIDLLRQYYYVGGMPSAVLAYVENQGLKVVRDVQKQILADYRRDFSKHAPAREVPRINMVWDSIPSQLAKENKKFIYGAIKKGARASEFEMAIQWLQDAGLVCKVMRCNKPQLPLKFYEDVSAFKLFMLDIGLMGAMVDAPSAAILIGKSIFSEYKGAFSELYVFSQLCSSDLPIYYHSVDNSTIEIDFLVQCQESIVPVEVKAEENVKAKSLRTFVNNNPELKAVRFSMLPFQDQGWMVNIPLYAVSSHLIEFSELAE